MKKHKLAILKEIYKEVVKHGDVSKAFTLRQQLVEQLK
jgi:hypothetical protein